MRTGRVFRAPARVTFPRRRKSHQKGVPGPFAPGPPPNDMLGLIFVPRFEIDNVLRRDELTLPQSPLPLIRRLKLCPALT